MNALDVRAFVPATVTVAVGEGGTVTPNLNGQILNWGGKYTLTAKPKSGFVFTGWSGSYTSSAPKLTFILSNAVSLTASFVDNKAPALKISPVLKSWSTNSVSNDVYVVTGTVKDNGTVAQVFVRANDGGWFPANTGNAYSNWWAQVSLLPDANTIYAYAVDNFGNVSKTEKLKIVYTAAQPNLYYPIQATMVVSNLGEYVEMATFSKNVFTDITGAGTYTYKRLSPDTASLSMRYFAPPSAVGRSTDVDLTMLYDVFYSGTFEEEPGRFFLYETDKLAPVTIDESTISLKDDNGSDVTVIRMLKNPSVGEGDDSYLDANPRIIPLTSPYPGDISNRVVVPFSRQVKKNGGYVEVDTPAYPGTVIDIQTNAVKVLFDKPFPSGKFIPLSGSPLRIVSYYFDSFVDGNWVTNGTGDYSYTNYTWVGSVLELVRPDQVKCVILTFTNEVAAGIYYDETHYSDSTVSTTSGSFDLTLPPQIITQPQDFGWTNGETVVFQVEAVGTPVLAYQWFMGGLPLVDGTTVNGSTAAGSTTSKLTLSNTSSNDFGAYHVVITNLYGSVTSSVANLTLAVPPQILAQPDNVVVTNGQTANFSVSVSGSSPITYRWQRNGSSLNDGATSWGSTISGAKTANLVITSVTTNDIAAYRVIVTNSVGRVTSSSALLNVISN